MAGVAGEAVQGLAGVVVGSHPEPYADGRADDAGEGRLA
jgi:hypothetical protein